MNRAVGSPRAAGVTLLAAVSTLLLGSAVTARAADDVVLQAKGYVIAAHQVQVAPAVGGTVVWVPENFVEGQLFKKGEVLSRVDDEACKADRDKARAALARARARLDGLDKAAKPQEREVARAEVEMAEADLKKAELRLAACTTRAPLTGVILSKKAEVGGYVNPLAFGASGYLCEMADLSDLEIEIWVQERDIALLSAGQACVAGPEAFAGDAAFLKKHPQGYKGTLARILPVADRAKGAIGVRVKIDRTQIPPEEQGVYLKPDMSVLVSFLKVKTEK
jgi:multidrug resistance efflux pump